MPGYTSHCAAEIPPATQDRYRILVIDDDQEMRTPLTIALQMSGYSVLTSSNGRQAVRTLIETPVDLVITDVFMPDFDGLEVIRAVRDCADHVPILAISGGSGMVPVDFLPIAELLGADAVLPKPFALRTLQARVRELLPYDREGGPVGANDNA